MFAQSEKVDLLTTVTAIYIAIFGMGMLVGGTFMMFGMMLMDPVCIAIRHFAQ